jgi:hypothetical protein
MKSSSLQKVHTHFQYNSKEARRFSKKGIDFSRRSRYNGINGISSIHLK